MKPSRYLTILTLLTTLLGPTTTRAQDTPLGIPQPPSAAQIRDVTMSTGQQLHQELAQAQRQLQQGITEVRHGVGEVTLNAVRPATLHAGLSMSGPVGRLSQPLLIRTRELDPESQTQLEEDLKVMSRILEKAAQFEHTRGPRAMGIDLVFGSGQSPVRSLYLDGYGALFMVNVNFPLLPLPVDVQSKTDDPKGDAASTWEQTRQELYGESRPPEPMLPIGWIGENPEALAYDANKVDRLRQNLIEAVKNASNIRQLTADESVTICVQGAPATPILQVRRESVIEKPGGSSQSVNVNKRLERVLRSGEKTDADRAILTFEARKADIDQFARGEITLEQFRKLARTQTYPGGGDWNTSGAFIWNSR
jgi:hypothetical protein